MSSAYQHALHNHAYSNSIVWVSKTKQNCCRICSKTWNQWTSLLGRIYSKYKTLTTFPEKLLRFQFFPFWHSSCQDSVFWLIILNFVGFRDLPGLITNQEITQDFYWLSCQASECGCVLLAIPMWDLRCSYSSGKYKKKMLLRELGEAVILNLLKEYFLCGGWIGTLLDKKHILMHWYNYVMLSSLRRNLCYLKIQN